MDNRFDETLWKELFWLRCLNCYKSAKYDRRFIILGCSHQWCYACFKKIPINSSGLTRCALCKRTEKFTPIFSKSLTERARTMLQPFNFDQQLSVLQYQRKQRILVTSKLIADTNKIKQMVQQYQKLSKLNEKITKDVNNARIRLFRGFSGAECNSVLAMPIQRLQEINIGKIISERLAMSSKVSS